MRRIVESDSRLVVQWSVSALGCSGEGPSRGGKCPKYMM